jgi:murein L,D-transpeptidase YcbB/YkuD
LGPIDTHVAEAIQKILRSEVGKFGWPDQNNTVITAFYTERKFAPIWIKDGAANARASAVIRYIGESKAEGLEPSDYRVPQLNRGIPPEMLADRELTLTSSVLAFAHDIQRGHTPPKELAKYIGYDLDESDQRDLLATIANDEDPPRVLDSLAPQHKAYQALKQRLSALRAGLDSDSILDTRQQADRIPLADIIIANMERWRWVPRDLGRAFVMVNIPDFTLGLFNDGHEIFKARVVVGRSSLPTPLMSASISSITVNPVWKVPQAMAEREFLVPIKMDPTLADRLGLKLSKNADGTTRLYQPPGEKNVLGRIRFNFPNKYLIFQHDTPDKFLFDLDVRAYSHGCLRVQDALGYAEALFSISQPDENYTRARLRGIAEDDARINLKTPIPVHLTYQTAFVDSDDRLVLRDDIYDLDSRMIAGIKRDRKIASASDRSIDKR